MCRRVPLHHLFHFYPRVRLTVHFHSLTLYAPLIWVWLKYTVNDAVLIIILGNTPAYRHNMAPRQILLLPTACVIVAALAIMTAFSLTGHYHSPGMLSPFVTSKCTDSEAADSEAGPLAKLAELTTSSASRSVAAEIHQDLRTAHWDFGNVEIPTGGHENYKINRKIGTSYDAAAKATLTNIAGQVEAGIQAFIKAAISPAGSHA